MNLLISIIEAIYILYMFCYFQTTFSIHHPLEYYLTGTFEHPISTGEYESKICPFGNKAIVLLAIWLILREFIDIEDKKRLNTIIMNITLALSLMNMNALLYFLPIYFYEIIYYNV